MNVHPFNDREGLRIAAEIERRGLNFYTRAQTVTKSAAVRALLAELIADERTHLNEFSRLYENAALCDEPEAYTFEASAYLSAIAADIVFPGGLSELLRDDGFDSVRGILEYGIRSEKDSILFYKALIERIADESAKDVFREVVRQETGHLSRLQSMLMEEKEA